MQSRRTFMKALGSSLLAIPFLASLEPFKAFAAEKMAKEGQGQAKSLHYCSNAKKPGSHCPERKAKDKADQFCSGCQMYSKTSGEGDKEIGKCLIIQDGLVHSTGWCMSWVKRLS